MTREEILKEYRIINVNFPKKGELFIAVKNSGGDCEINTCTKDMKYVKATIVEKIK